MLLNVLFSSLSARLLYIQIAEIGILFYYYVSSIYNRLLHTTRTLLIIGILCI